MNLKGIHVILIAIACLILFEVTHMAIFDFAFVIGLIVGIVQMVKEWRAKKKQAEGQKPGVK